MYVDTLHENENVISRWHTETTLRTALGASVERMIAFGVVVLPVLLGILLIWAIPSTIAKGLRDVPGASQAVTESVVYLFDPLGETFVFTYTLPVSGGPLWDIVSSSNGNHQDVWFTEPSYDRLHHLVYTDTLNYEVETYTLPTGSYPLNLALDGDKVWYTMPGRNRIGRLQKATGDQVEYEVPTANAYPADLTVAPDGSIWFTEMLADQFARLSTDPVPSVEEYTIASMAGGRPYGIAWVYNGVYIVQTANNVLTRYTPSSEQWVNIRGVTPSVPNGPFRLTVQGMRVWATERIGNRITAFEYGTFSVAIPYQVEPSGSVPTDLVAGVDGRIWFTQWAANRIGALRASSGSSQQNYFSLPAKNQAPTGIATNATGGLWLVASSYHRLYLPLVSKGN